MFQISRRVKMIALGVLTLYSLVFAAAGYGLGHLF